MTVSFTQSPSSLASWTYSGMRMGPDGVSASTRRAKLLQYGNGFPCSPICSYSFVPGAIATGNITGSVATDLTEAPAWIPLVTARIAGDQVVTPYYGGPSVPLSAAYDGVGPSQIQNGKVLALQFQLPCQIKMVTTAGPGSVKFTVFGYDWYGEAMQVEFDSSLNTTLTSGAAFYGVTGIWCGGGAAAVAQTVQFSTIASYGLPYKLDDRCDLISFGLGTEAQASTPNPLNGVAVPAGVTLAGAVGPDVRGCIMSQDGFVPDNSIKVTLTYFVRGADSASATVLNAISRGKNPSLLPWSETQQIPGSGDLFGINQFYEGYPQ